jgi:hypothetical protein
VDVAALKRISNDARRGETVSVLPAGPLLEVLVASTAAAGDGEDKLSALRWGSRSPKGKLGNSRAFCRL